jgi:2-keto-4-pentenoate hydratase/2-oxohepta-3-ene-1,7-dioic acid hydratase in catechol pathway
MRAVRVVTPQDLELRLVVDDVAIPPAFESSGHLTGIVEGFERFGAMSRWRPLAGEPATSTPMDDCVFGPPLSVPGRIVGIGLNFELHAGDLAAAVPRRPVVFFKGDHTVVGPGETTEIPIDSRRVTAEAELGLVIGTAAYRVDPSRALDYVGGVCCVLDFTAEDILLEDPRLLTLSKNYPGFFAYGPEIASLEDVIEAAGSLDAIAIATYVNGRCHRSGTVRQMMHGLAQLVSFISHFMPLRPGDLISTGTPGAAVVVGGDVAECRITGLRPLTSRVSDSRSTAAEL